MRTRVGSIDDLPPGRMRVVSVGGEDVTVANADGAIVAFADTCPHMGCSLADGSLTGTVVTCACHGSQFDVRSGDVLRGPAEEGVNTWHVAVEEGSISVEV